MSDRAKKIEEEATKMAAIWDRATMEGNSRTIAKEMGHDNYRAMFDAWKSLRAALSQPVEPVASECSMCGVLEARIEELKDEVTRMQARVEGAWQAGHDAHVRIEQATIEALRDRVHWLEGHDLALPEEPSASGGDAAPATKEEP